MDPLNHFKWRHHQAEIFLPCPLVSALFPQVPGFGRNRAERGLLVDHTTIYRWVQQYVPKLEKRAKPHLKTTNDSWRTDETSLKIKKIWTYLYRAVDSEGNTLQFMLSTTRDAAAATPFFCKALGASHTSTPIVITADKNPTYPEALSDLKALNLAPESCELRQAKFLNNIVEQDHRFI